MEILNEIHQFYTFYLKIMSPCGGGVMKFTIFRTGAKYQIW